MVQLKPARKRWQIGNATASKIDSCEAAISKTVVNLKRWFTLFPEAAAAGSVRESDERPGKVWTIFRTSDSSGVTWTSSLPCTIQQRQSFDTKQTMLAEASDKRGTPLVSAWYDRMYWSCGCCSCCCLPSSQRSSIKRKKMACMLPGSQNPFSGSRKTFF